MSKSSKALLILILFLTGCSAKKLDHPITEKVVFPKPLGQAVNAPVSVSDVWNNPITIISKKISETALIYASSIEISGLKNTAVQTKINAAIQARFDQFLAYQDLTKLPPFRGIRQRIQSTSVLTSLNVYASVAYNANNVLSVVFNTYVAITNPDTTQAYVNVTDGMTFELISGNLLSLADIFTDKADISKLVNDSLTATLNKMDSQDDPQNDPFSYVRVTQVAPFTGIKADQPFFLSDQGLNLIVDYRTPVFETGLNSQTLLVPFFDLLKQIGITERFVSADLFTAPLKDRQFLNIGPIDKTILVETLGDPAGNDKLRIDYPIDLDPRLIRVLMGMKEEAKTQLSAYMALHKTSYASAAASVSLSGPYACLFESGEAYSDASDFLMISKFACYDKNLKKMNLADYFKPGYDYESAIKVMIESEIQNGNLAKDISVDQIYASLSIRITTTGFYLSAQAYSPALGQTQFFGISPLFSAFGLDNLSVFD